MSGGRCIVLALGRMDNDKETAISASLACDYFFGQSIASRRIPFKAIRLENKMKGANKARWALLASSIVCISK